jgi:hypothetical protein
MQRVTRSTAAGVLPAIPASPGSPGYFTGGDPIAGVPATVPGYEWFNGVQEELIAAIVGAGVTPAAATLTQLRQALRRAAGGNVSLVTGTGAITVDQAGVVIVTVTAGSTLTLPRADAAGGMPYRITFVRTDAVTNQVVLARAATDLIDGQTSFRLIGGQRVTLVSDGVSNWYAMASRPVNDGHLVVTATITLQPDWAGVIAASAAAAAVTMTLPAANAWGGLPGTFTFVRTDASANVLSVARAGSDLIEGLTSFPIPVGSRVTLRSNGVDAWRVVAIGGAWTGMQVFTAGGTFTVPAGVYRIKGRVWGGGGGGGTPGGGPSGGGGGGAGAYAEGVFDVVPGQTITVTVGAAGAVAGNGGTSSLGALLSCTGGVGGGVSAGGAAGTPTGGQLQITGQGGASGSVFGGVGLGGNGGAAFGGSGGYGTLGVSAQGLTPGGGGSGGGNGNSGSGGGAGRVIVEW